MPTPDTAVPRRHRFVALSLLAVGGGLGLILLPGCRELQSFDAPIPVDATFAKGSPDEAFLARCRAAADYSAQADGRAVLVVSRDREILFEAYHNGHRATTPHHLYSGTKSFAGVLAMAAVAEGKLSLDERVADTITEWQADPAKAKVTVRQLLDFTSGLEQAFWRLTRDALLVQQRVPDKYRVALGLGLEHAPGEVYSYGSSHLMVFGELVKRKLGDPLDYLQKQVFGPIGFRYAGWIRDPAGNPTLPFGCWTTAREWAKFGVLMLSEGRWGETQVIPAELLAECRQGSQAMPAYGLTFWLNQSVPPERRAQLIPQLKRHAKEGPVILPSAPTDLYVAAGHNGNRCYVLPTQGWVVVRLGTSVRPYDDATFLRHLLGEGTQ